MSAPRFPAPLIAVLLLACASSPGAAPVFRAPEPATPCTACAAPDFRNDPENFQFAILPDRTGGRRPGVFRAALDRLNLLQPEFVFGVGDLIEGYSEDRVELAAMWDEVETALGGLDMPFFFVAGNHDIGNGAMRDLWHRRLGRDYYHFLYRDVLFLVLNTEDPPVALPKETLEGIAYFKKLLAEDPAKARALVEDNREQQEKLHLPVAISAAQIAYVASALRENPEVRWTFVFMHKPAWEYESESFARIEELLRGRPHTLFAGHRHNYRYSRRNGNDYIRLGTAGGVWHHEGPGSMDHLTWVTMTADGPIIANVLLSGILDERGPRVATEASEFVPE